MAYITQAELLDFISNAELIQLTDDANSGAVDAAKVTAAIDAAGAEIDAYAGTRYTVPLQTSTKVKQLARDIAIYHLEKRRRVVRDSTQKAYDAAMKFLRDLSDGKAVLDQPSGATAQTAEGEVKTTEKVPKIFTDDTLTNF